MKKTRTRGNGLGTVYRDGKYWRAQVNRYEFGERFSKSKSGFLTKTDALRWCALNADFADAGVCPTFERVFYEWSAAHYPTISEKKRQQYNHVFECSGRISKRKFNELTVRHFQQIINEQKETYNVRKIFKNVYSMMSVYAIRNGWASVNYAELVELPPEAKPDKHPFTADEVHAVADLWDRTHDFYAGACLIMIYTGMRWGEISTIKPENIHLSDGFLTGGIKTEAGRTGEIILIPRVRPIVAEIMLPENRVSKITAEGFRKGYNKMLDAAGVSRHTVHECRHTTATMLALMGVQPAIISAIMRHSSYSQTMDYTHVPRAAKLDELSKIV